MTNISKNTDNLLNMLKSIDSKVESQVSKSTEEVKSYTKRLTWHDKLITDDLLLNLEPDILKASMASNEYTEFIKKYPDYEINYNNWLTSKKSANKVEVDDSLINQGGTLVIEQTSEKINEQMDDIYAVNEIDETKIMKIVNDDKASQSTFKPRSEKKPKVNWLSALKKKLINKTSIDEQFESDSTEYTDEYEKDFIDPDKPTIWKSVLNISVIIIVIIITYFLIN